MITSDEFWSHIPCDLECHIYLLRRPDTNEIFYVGFSGDLERRLTQHTKRLGFTPSVEIIETLMWNGLGRTRVLQAERKWIAHYVNLGIELENIIDNPKVPQYYLKRTLKASKKY
jgi:predicted GIY-YIG superfamily endonuclease